MSLKSLFQGFIWHKIRKKYGGFCERKPGNLEKTVEKLTLKTERNDIFSIWL